MSRPPYTISSMSRQATPPALKSKGTPRSRFAVDIFGEADIGERPYMEDVICAEKVGKREAFLGVFDGHGGKDAAQFAKEALWSNISAAKGFYSSKGEVIKKAIHQGFLATHHQMWSERLHWKSGEDGTLSEAGTTASVVIIRQDRMFVANVGDSTVVLAHQFNPCYDEYRGTTGGTPSCLSERAGQVRAVVLTDDHKPESPKEKRRIEQIGGRVLPSAGGIMRVAAINPYNPCEMMPVLNIGRSLGDLWSYTKEHNDYFVSPEPDVTEYKVDASRHKFVVIASDGLWNAMTPQEVVEFVHAFRQRELAADANTTSSQVAHALILKALEGWHDQAEKADNISVLIAFFQPKNKPKPHF